MSMFCFQCQEAAKGTGCTVRGICGKTDEVAKLQDLLLYVVKGIAIYNVKAKEAGLKSEKADTFIVKKLLRLLCREDKARAGIKR